MGHVGCMREKSLYCTFSKVNMKGTHTMNTFKSWLKRVERVLNGSIWLRIGLKMGSLADSMNYRVP